MPVEGTDREFLAQEWAVELAAALEVPVRAVHVAPHAGTTAPDVFSYLQNQCKKWGVACRTTVVHGSDVAQELSDELTPRDLVVVGTRKLASHYHVGSVAGELVRKAPCPVQVVRLQ